MTKLQKNLNRVHLHNYGGIKQTGSGLNHKNISTDAKDIEFENLIAEKHDGDSEEEDSP